MINSLFQLVLIALRLINGLKLNKAKFLRTSFKARDFYRAIAGYTNENS
jgi:hypothetical protein